MKYEELMAGYERLRAENRQLKQELTEAQRQIAELKRQLFGSKAESLTPVEQEQLDELQKDLEEATERPEAIGEEVLGEEEPAKGPKRTRRPRQPLPEHLEEETVALQPELEPCPGCGKMPEKIGEEVTEEIDYIPARLIRRKIVRSKYGCRCGAAGVTIAALPPRLIPQSRLGLGLATHITLARFDDHLSFYRLEQQFRERHGVVIARQQMVQ
jgi:transposase